MMAVVHSNRDLQCKIPTLAIYTVKLSSSDSPYKTGDKPFNAKTKKQIPDILL